MRDSLATEIADLKDPADTALVMEHYNAILLRAINHHDEKDAFVSLKDWAGQGGKVFRGILADYA